MIDLKLQHNVQNGFTSSLITFFVNLTYFSGGFRSWNIWDNGEQFTTAAKCLWLMTLWRHCLLPCTWWCVFFWSGNSHNLWCRPI